MNIRTTHTRAPALALTVAAACAAALPAHAAEQSASKQENIGVATGLTIGALAAGPFGAIFGAAAGAWLGDRYHQQAMTNTTLAADLTASHLDRAKLNATLFETQARGEQLAQRLEQRRDLETQVIFRTSDATLPAGAFEQLKKLGALVNTMPDMRVRVSGYTDPRGTEELNTTLSQERADAVAAALASSGIEPSRLVVEAHGESAVTAAEGDLEGYAFERKVVVRIEQVIDEAVAQR